MPWTGSVPSIKVVTDIQSPKKHLRMTRPTTKSLICALAVGLVAIMAPIQSAVAAPAPVKVVAQGNVSSPSSDGEVKPACSGCGTGTTVSKVSSARVNNRHAKYLTSAWAKAGDYTWTETVTTTATLSSSVGVSAKTVSSSIGATYSTSKGYAVATRIPASSKKYSKLAIRADYNKNYVRVTKKIQSVTISTKYTYLYSPIKGTQTLYIRYK